MLAFKKFNNGNKITFLFFNNTIYIYKRLCPRKKNPQQKKRKSRKSNFFMKLNTKPLKFKCGLADEGGGAGVPGGRAGRPMQGMGTPT